MQSGPSVREHAALSADSFSPKTDHKTNGYTNMPFQRPKRSQSPYHHEGNHARLLDDLIDRASCSTIVSSLPRGHTPLPRQEWPETPDRVDMTQFFCRTPLSTTRQRASQACEKCRERKTKCSGERPVCQRCRSRGLICEYAQSKNIRRANNRLRYRPDNSASGFCSFPVKEAQGSLQGIPFTTCADIAVPKVYSFGASSGIRNFGTFPRARKSTPSPSPGPSTSFADFILQFEDSHSMEKQPGLSLFIDADATPRLSGEPRHTSRSSSRFDIDLPLASFYSDDDRYSQFGSEPLSATNTEFSSSSTKSLAGLFGSVMVDPTELLLQPFASCSSSDTSSSVSSAPSPFLEMNNISSPPGMKGIYDILLPEPSHEISTSAFEDFPKSDEIRALITKASQSMPCSVSAPVLSYEPKNA
ncbi:hypothetical protein HYDPIDRAFT_105734 [Hydnomerulius pinastri MD-312]|nr:hypothetical protein HYDPIDRAFT_105734 [Hydnomerulius pinastri MD-312]